ncbi:MAG TPA: PQQ-dependent sugar dehydrogenase [Gemmataceae bacterium]|nr:PQQ-dependent sugar dehydrogenase [Gemmataceae bacterium]
MKRLFALLTLLALTSTAWAGDKKLPKPLLTGLKNPESVCVGPGGRLFVTEIGEFGKDGDGKVLVVGADGKATTFTAGLDDPKGIVAWTNLLFVTDNKRVMKIDPKGKATVFAAEKAFPIPPLFLNDITVDEKGVLYVSDSGDLKGNAGAVFRIDQKGKVTLVTDSKRDSRIKTPNGLVMDGMNHLLMLDFGSGELRRIAIKDGKSEMIADGFDGGDGLAWDLFGRLFITSWKTGKVWGIPRPGAAPILLAEGFESAADLCIDPTSKFMLIPDMKAGTLVKLTTTIPGWEVDESPLPIKTAVAFPELKWTGWKGETDTGKLFPLRPLVLTHAGDGTNRVFVAIQQGTIHTFANTDKAQATKIFLNIEKQVFYHDSENEQGLLGLAFHPQYKKTGEFFVFYTLKKDKTTNIISRFKVKKDNPDEADPASEEILMTIKRPFWNHDGGTICFGPDGYLYIALGDGGKADDPFKNGQKLSSLLGKILRIDVNSKSDGKAYGIPKDNPFVGKEGALPETWAYGLRNVWRMAFDRKTGKLWASDVGQNLYEEIDIIVKGGNYGWSIREGLHPFSTDGVGPRKDLIDPIWEYHHDLGKSNTGGVVYRGKNLPMLDGYYLYGDYITTKIWGLKYDENKKRVVANHPIANPNVSILSFGEDEQGEVYMLTTTVGNRGIFRFVKQ